MYVSAHVETGYAQTAYVRAHEAFVTALVRSGLSYTVVRPTGILTALNDFARFAGKVHPADVAAIALMHLTSGPTDAPIGGPEVFTRQQIAELAFRVLSKEPRILHVPAAVFRMSSRLAGLFNPRIGDLLEFVAAVSMTDCVAPAIGCRRLQDHFRAVAAGNY